MFLVGCFGNLANMHLCMQSHILHAFYMHSTCIHQGLAMCHRHIGVAFVLLTAGQQEAGRKDQPYGLVALSAEDGEGWRQRSWAVRHEGTTLA